MTDPRALLAPLLTDPARAAEIPAEQVSALLGELEHLRAALWVRLVTAPAASAPAPEPTRLLAADEVAAWLGVPKSYVYELARRRTPDALPTVAFGKYVRFAVGDVVTWVARHRRGRIDAGVSVTYTPSHDGQRGAAPPTAARADASATGRKDRRAQELGRPVGARRARDPGVGCPTDADPGGEDSAGTA